VYVCRFESYLLQPKREKNMKFYDCGVCGSTWSKMSSVKLCCAERKRTNTKTQFVPKLVEKNVIRLKNLPYMCGFIMTGERHGILIDEKTDIKDKRLMVALWDCEYNMYKPATLDRNELVEVEPVKIVAV